MMARRRAVSILFTLSIALGPVYWLPGISPTTTVVIKSTILLALIIILSLLVKPIFRASFTATFLALCILSAVGGIFHLDMFIVEVIPAIIIAYFGAQLSKIYSPDYMIRLLNRSAAIFSALSTLVIFDFLMGGRITNPYYDDYSVYLFESGLTGGRTGWAYACNLMMATLAASLIYLSRRGKSTIISVLAIAALYVNIFVSGARGGFLVASTIVFFLLIASTQSRRGLLSISGILGLFFLVSMYFLDLEKIAELRVIRTFLSTYTRDMTTVDSRIDLQTLGWEMFAESPLLGSGQVSFDLGSEQLAIHNVWLRFLVERGILIGAPILLILVSLLIRASKRSLEIGYRVHYLIATGVVTGFFEPRGPMGNYFASMIFWIAVGYFAYFDARGYRNPLCGAYDKTDSIHRRLPPQ